MSLPARKYLASTNFFYLSTNFSNFLKLNFYPLRVTHFPHLPIHVTYGVRRSFMPSLLQLCHPYGIYDLAPDHPRIYIPFFPFLAIE